MMPLQIMIRSPGESIQKGALQCLIAAHGQPLSQGIRKAGCVPRKGRDEHCWMLVQYSQELGDLDVTVMSWSGGNCS